MAPPGKDADPLASLRNEEPGPLYYIGGRERFFVDRAVEILRARVLVAATKDFNQDVFHGKEVRASSIISAARTLPMMAKRRLVLVRDADEMKADELTALVPYILKPCAETCLVFVGEKADQRLKFFTAFKKTGQQLKFEPLYENRLPGFVNEEARMRGVRFEPGAAQMVCDEVGAELAQLADAVERLAIFVGERALISAKDVEQVVATTRQRNVFELCNAVGEGDRARALEFLSAMLGAREAPVRIVAMLARHVRQLWTARELLKRRLDKFELAQALGVPPFFVDGIAAQARSREPAQFAQMHDAVFRADKALKSSRLDDDRIMEQLILELTTAKPRASERRA